MLRVTFMGCVWDHFQKGAKFAIFPEYLCVKGFQISIKSVEVSILMYFCTAPWAILHSKHGKILWSWFVVTGHIYWYIQDRILHCQQNKLPIISSSVLKTTSHSLRKVNESLLSRKSYQCSNKYMWAHNYAAIAVERYFVLTAEQFSNCKFRSIYKQRICIFRMTRFNVHFAVSFKLPLVVMRHREVASILLSVSSRIHHSNKRY